MLSARGSSPLTRGKQDLGLEHLGGGRLIPAHAGKTTPVSSRAQICQAHPRSRGENRIAIYNVTTTGGSSPLTRGKLNDQLQTFGSLVAHPRSRGENINGIRATASRIGSSPLTRGKPIVKAAKAAGTGLIPAHAGKT